MMAQVTRTAEAEGLTFDFDRAIIANTFDAHRLLWFADQPEAVFFGATADTQPELVEALHQAHFTARARSRLARCPGLARRRRGSRRGPGMSAAVVDGGHCRRPRADRPAHDLGITSVPTFIFAGTYAVTGAQEVRTMRSVLDEVARRERLAPTASALIPQQRTAPVADDDTRVA